jgi:hypothetical protein
MHTGNQEIHFEVVNVVQWLEQRRKDLIILTLRVLIPLCDVGGILLDEDVGGILMNRVPIL